MKSTLLVATVLAVTLTGCSDAQKAKPEAKAAKAAEPKAGAQLARAKAEAANTAKVELAKIQEQDRAANENKRRVEEEVKRQLEANKQEREDRLAKVALRRQNEIPPLEEEVGKIKRQIATGDGNMEKLRAQQGSLPASSGVPKGTKFQPAIPREVREIEMQARQRWEALEKGYARLRAELVDKLRVAEDRLRKKDDELERERQKILGDF